MPIQDLLEKIRSLSPDEVEEVAQRITSKRFQGAHAKRTISPLTDESTTEKRKASQTDGLSTAEKIEFIEL